MQLLTIYAIITFIKTDYYYILELPRKCVKRINPIETVIKEKHQFICPQNHQLSIKINPAQSMGKKPFSMQSSFANRKASA